MAIGNLGAGQFNSLRPNQISSNSFNAVFFRSVRLDPSLAVLLTYIVHSKDDK